MRPTVTEQIESLARILKDVVAPEVTAPYPAEILRGVIGALSMLARAVPQVPEFLAWDADATAAVLSAALPSLTASLAEEVHAALGSRADHADLPALEARQRTLRGLLVAAMPAISAEPHGDAYRLMTAHSHERAERYPFPMSAQPVKKPEKKEA